MIKTMVPYRVNRAVPGSQGASPGCRCAYMYTSLRLSLLRERGSAVQARQYLSKIDYRLSVIDRLVKALCGRV